ncbi:Uncharacterised protein [uncultured archaeon]|nr:Uncharacterised protein [uncultured archaeon]
MCPRNKNSRIARPQNSGGNNGAGIVDGGRDACRSKGGGGSITLRIKQWTVVVVILIVIMVATIIIGYKQKEMSPTIKPNGEKIPLEAAWIIQTGCGTDTLSCADKILKDVTEDLNNRRYIELHEKSVPTDVVDRESLYISFKAEDLAGYYIFAITPGDTLGFATGKINVNYIGMRKDNDALYLDIQYKSNKEFGVDIFYSKNPGIHNVPVVLTDHKIHYKNVLNAYPIDNNLISVNTNAESTSSWKYISFKLDDPNFNPNNTSNPEKYIWIPHLKYESKKIDIAQTFLDEIDKNFQDKNVSKFVWDEQKVTKENVSKIVNEFKKKGYDIVNIYLSRIKLGENIPPTITQGVAICGIGTTCYNDKIRITVEK